MKNDRMIKNVRTHIALVRRGHPGLPLGFNLYQDIPSKDLLELSNSNFKQKETHNETTH